VNVEPEQSRGPPDLLDLAAGLLRRVPDVIDVRGSLVRASREDVESCGKTLATLRLLHDLIGDALQHVVETRPDPVGVGAVVPGVPANSAGTAC
jgi:hypothetical protein